MLKKFVTWSRQERLKLSDTGKPLYGWTRQMNDGMTMNERIWIGVYGYERKNIVRYREKQ